jgi:hypothetical protein
MCIIEGVVVGEASGGQVYGRWEGGAEAAGEAVVVDNDVKVEEHVVKYTKALKQG